MVKPKRLLYMLASLMVIGLLLQLRNTAPLIDHVLVLAFFAILLSGSAFLLVRMWRKRLDPKQLHRPPSQIDLLPRRWRRWVLDEDQPPPNSN
jgi:positive regulator of sigma E activity